MKILLYMAIVTNTLLAFGFTTKENKQIVLNQSFTKICLQGNMKVILVQSDSSNTIFYKNGKITAEVQNGELTVKQKNSFFKDSEPFILIPVSVLTAIIIKDDAAVFSKTTITTHELTINQHSNGIVKLSIDAAKVLVCSRGTGKIQIDGNYQQTLAQKDETGCMVIEYKAK